MKKLFLPILCLLILMVTTSQASSLQPPATGQTILQATGDDGAIQAGKPWPVPRFTDNRNGTIRDDLTGLLWSGDANLLATGSFVAGSGGVVTWQGALDEIKRLNANAYLGFNDWRLPNLNELASLVHQGEPVQSRWLNRQGFSNTTASSYWSSSSAVRETDSAWTVHFESGSVGSLQKSGVAHVWPVRGASGLLPATGQSVCYDIAGLKAECSGTGQDGELRMGALWPALRFSDNGDGTISDNLTGLVWPKNASPALAARVASAAGGPALWLDALEFVASLNSSTYLGYGDWRLPNRNELVSLVNYAETTPGVQLGMAGVEGLQERYWSSGTSAADPSAAWDVATTGEVAERSKFDPRFGSYIWPVRGGIEAQATSGAQSKNLSKTVAAAVPLSVTTATLPAGTIGITYSQTLAATGGTTPYTWSRKSGTLPVGLTLSTTGVISGKPTTAGTKTFIVQVKDKAAKTATKSLSITVSATPVTPPSITTAALNNGLVAVSYSQALAATGGKTPYTWTRTAGNLPAGLTLSTTGVISGKPTTVGNSSFTVQVKDANNALATKALTVAISVPLTLDTTQPAYAATVGAFYSFAPSVSGGTLPFSWSVVSGTLPSGVTLDTATGIVSGILTTPGWSSEFSLQVKDANNATSSGLFALYTVPAPSIVTDSAYDSFASLAYAHQLFATGGLAPYSWSIVSGSLPPGMALNPATGKISGTAISVGNNPFTIQAKDSNNAVVTKSYSIAITTYGSISGTVTDQASGAPLSGVAVNLKLTGITNHNVDDLIYTCNNSVPFDATELRILAENDGVKYKCNTYISSSGNVMLFKVRNPFGITDSFSAKWNGAAAPDHHENLAQRFKPTRTGLLTKASFHLPSNITHPYGTMTGTIRVMLKSRLGGDAGTYLAISNPVDVVSYASGAPVWVDFTFPAPVAVTAGQDYFLEITGKFYAASGYYGYYASITWSGSTYVDGPAFFKDDGIWTNWDSYGTYIGSQLAFRAYVDDQPDITTDTLYNDQLFMSGVNMNSSAYSPDISFSVLGAGTASTVFNGPTSNNDGDDITGTLTAISNPASYYDPDGWLQFTITGETDNIYRTVVVTDQFNVTFNRTYTAVTDANGAYSFPGLPDGNYTVSFDRIAYNAASVSGTLLPGQNATLSSSMTITPTATLQGLVVNYYASQNVAGASVIVTDVLGNRFSVLTDELGNYRVDGITAGAYSATFAAARVITQTVTGILAPGQVKQLGIWFTPAPVTVTITTPIDGSVVSTPAITVTGSVINADNVIIMTDTGLEYPVSLLGGAFSASIPLDVGQTQVSVYAPSSNNGKGDIKSVVVTRTAFSLRNLGDIGNVAVMEVNGNFDAKNPDGSDNIQPRKGIAAEYFRTHNATDFLIYLSTFDYTMAESGAKGFYTGLKNDIQGINQQPFDFTAQYGSNGKLQGTVDAGNVTTLAANPYGAQLDQLLALLAHEQMHRYGAYVRFRNADGSLNSALLGKDSTHWSYLLDTKGSHLYGNDWKANTDGTFTSVAALNSYSPLDLYLMGMIPKEQVPPMLLIDNPAIDKTLMPQPGATITGTATTVIIDDIIAAEGARIPNATFSQKQFNIGYVLLTRAGDNTAAATQAIETVRKAYAGKFAELTQGKGSIADVPAALELYLDSPADGASIAGPDAAVSGLAINSTGAKTTVTINGITASVMGNRFAINSVPLTEGNNTITVTATDANGLTATTSRSITSVSGYTLGSVPGLIVGIAAPAQDASVAGPETTVSGMMINSTGAATTVTVNGVPATVANNKFVVNGVPLQEGNNSITVTATDANGLTATATRSISSAAGYTLGSVPGLIVGIASPANGATVIGPDVNVSGIVINGSGTETGVTVNGIVATVNGNSFVANHVPLQEGSNSITITATDANGLTATTIRSVTAVAGNYIRINSNIESGTGPLDISFRLDGSFSISNPTVTASGPVPVMLTLGASPAEYIATLTTVGIYTVTVSAVGPDGQTYTDSVTVTAISRSQLENLLKGKWEGINSKISQNDAEGAVNYLATPYHAQYREMFTSLGSRLSVLSENLPPVQLVYATEERAKCRVSRIETVLGQQKMVSYPVYFIKENGIWKLIKY